MLPRIDLLFALMLALASCTALPARPVTTAVVATQEAPATPVPTAAALPQASPLLSPAQVANWRLSTAEIDYMFQFSTSMDNWTPGALDDFSKVSEPFRKDPTVLNSNAWRTQATAAARTLDGARLWFTREAPSDRFAPITEEVGKAIDYFAEAAQALRSLVDTEDETQLGLAIERINAGLNRLYSARQTFDLFMVGPPEN